MTDSTLRPGSVISPRAWPEPGPLLRLARRLEGETPAIARTTVSVVMTAYNAEDSIESAVLSILGQTHQNLELIVVDDASTDATPNLLRALRMQDPRIRVLRAAVNRGTYWAKNLGILHARGRFVALQDADDVSVPDRISQQLTALLTHPGAVLSTSNYVRVDEDGNVRLNRGVEQRLGFITVLFDRERVLGRVGFFDSVRTSADDEFFHRVKHVFGTSALVHVDKPLYHASVRSDSLTAGEVSLDSTEGKLSHLTSERADYVRDYRAWHRSQEVPFVPFPPPSERPFPAGPNLLIPESPANTVSVSVASIPERADGLHRVVEALLPQCDRLFVYLNGYEDQPDFLDHEKIEVARSQDHGDLRDNGKFFFTDRIPVGYHFTVDDDIFYPADYVTRTVAKLQQYGDRALVGYHATVLPEFPEEYFGPSRDLVHFMDDLSEDRSVNLIGTGTLAYHTNTLRLSHVDFESTGMADLWVAIATARARVPMVAAARRRGFLKPMREYDQADSLFKEYRRNDEVHVALLKRAAPWRVIPVLDGELMPAPRLPARASSV